MTGAYNYFIYTMLQCCTLKLLYKFTEGWAEQPSRPIKCAGEQPPTMVSESDCESSKARGCLSSIMDPHSHDHLHGSAPSPVSPCSRRFPWTSCMRCRYCSLSLIAWSLRFTGDGTQNKVECAPSIRRSEHCGP